MYGSGLVFCYATAKLSIAHIHRKKKKKKQQKKKKLQLFRLNYVHVWVLFDPEHFHDVDKVRSVGVVDFIIKA